MPKISYSSKTASEGKKLAAAFCVLVLLIIGIGALGITRIEKLSRRVESLGRQGLALEKTTLEMKVNNALYASGIRNYVFWRVSRYLGAVTTAANLKNAIEASGQFKKGLKDYADRSYSPRQKKWAGQIGISFAEVTALGAQIVQTIDAQAEGDSAEIARNLLMAFENSSYKIDKFLDDVMGKDNLNRIESQLIETESERRATVFTLTFALFSAVGLGTVTAFLVYRRIQRDVLYRRQIFNRLINLEENERKSLSAEIHDQLGQDLSALKISLGIIERDLDREPAHIKNRLSKLRKLVSEIIDKSHNIAYMLRPPAIDEAGLSEAIEGLLVDYRHLTKTEFSYQKPSEELDILPEHKLLFYRITQELLTNMAKHSQAAKVKVRLEREGDFIKFFYEDDGAGFDYKEVSKQPQRRKEDKFKLGLIGLKERVELLDGLIHIDSSPGKGTLVSVKLLTSGKKDEA